MLEVHAPLDELFLYVTGYDDGSDWLIGLPEPRGRVTGKVASVGGNDRYVWTALRGGEIAIYDALERGHVGMVTLPEPPLSVLLHGSRDGRHLYALTPQGRFAEARYALFVIDPATAKIVARHDSPYQSITEVAEDAEGRLIYPATVRRDRVYAGLGRIDPVTGAREDSIVEDVGQIEAFRWHSPDGRYWLRRDNRIGRQEVADGPRRLFGKPAKTPFYTTSVQLWETWPLRFVRWLPVGWHLFENLPDLNRKTDAAVRQKAWDAIVAASEATPHDPLVRVTPPDLKGPNDGTLGGTEAGSNWSHLIEWTDHLGWEDDGTAFWTHKHGLVTRVAIEGIASVPQFVRYPQPRGLPQPPFRSRALPRRRLEVSFIHPIKGTMIFESQADGPGRPIEVPLELHPNFDAGLRERIEAATKDRSRIVVPLRSWSEADAIAAIDAVTAEIAASLAFRAVTHHIYAVFPHDGREIGEQEFFTSVAASFPAAGPAIARLIETACDKMHPSMELYSAADEVGLLGYAARALGLMDLRYLPTLRRYRDIVIDTEHETFFTTKTVPLMIETHGWSGPMVEFVFWLLMIGNTNGIDHYGYVWEKWGLRDAVLPNYTPATFAELTRRLCGEPPEPDKRYPIAHTYRGVDRFRRDYAMLRTPEGDLVAEGAWLAEYFALLKTPEPDPEPEEEAKA